MKKLILMIAFMAGIGAMAHAQVMTQKTPEQRAAHMTKMLQKRLNLTSDQATQVNNIMFTNANRMDSLKNNLSATDNRSNALTRRSIMVNTDQKMLAVLNDDQKKAYMQLKEMQKEKRMSKQNAAPATQTTPM